MRTVIQRVKEAKVTVNNKCIGKVEQGLLVFIGIEDSDTREDIEWLCKKIVQLRIFADDDGFMNKSIMDIDGNILLISQFTLHAKVKKGNRPSFIQAAKPEVAIPLYEQVIMEFNKQLNKTIATGKFGADMQVTLINDGPVTITIDTKNKE